MRPTSSFLALTLRRIPRSDRKFEKFVELFGRYGLSTEVMGSIEYWLSTFLAVFYGYPADIWRTAENLKPQRRVNPEDENDSQSETRVT